MASVSCLYFYQAFNRIRKTVGQFSTNFSYKIIQNFFFGSGSNEYWK